ncbi:hypothetical protein C0Q70_11819 [Pomacea canaliculata]|uniref:C2H2-type domain-containing protein n=1 Tax=Pomacea canaliculata TaxID=400727 RepID=A0A2T7P716_POMCA|nr:hypothetical protein C0Q70_11819 [Pomacea canaliculata]
MQSSTAWLPKGLCLCLYVDGMHGHEKANPGAFGFRCCTQDGGRSLGLGDAAADGPPTLYKLDLGCEAKAGLRCGTGVGSCLCHHSSTQEVCVSASPPDLQPHRGGGTAEDAAWKKERDCGKSEEMGGYDTPNSPLHCPSPPPPRACTPLPFPTPSLGTDSSPHLLTGGGGSSNTSASSLSSFSSLPSSCPSSLLSSIISPSASLASLFGVSRALEPQHHHYHNNNNHHYHHLNNHHNHHHHTNNNLLHHHHHHHYPPHPLESSSLIGSKDKGSNSNNSSSNNINSSSNDAAKDGQTSLSSSSSGAASLGGTTTTSATTAAPSSSSGTTSSEPSPASAAGAEETAVACQWKTCGAEVSPADLLEHLRHVHVDTQSGGETFVCQWAGCKVVGKASCSMSWLERHVVTHSGHKPYKCILPHCGARFPSQAALHRHVNAHFVTQGPATANRSSRPRGEEPRPACSESATSYGDAGHSVQLQNRI